MATNPRRRVTTYDNIGNLLTVDGPLSGTADTTRYRYDADRRLIGTTSPSPGNGQPDRATRITYNADGQVSKQEAGTVADQSDTAWTNFSSLQEADTGFDSYGRPITKELLAGGVAYALTQVDYDARGRSNCAAVRMNPSVYGALPSSACTLSTPGSYGPDRISQTAYDWAGHVTQVQEGVGTADAANERTIAYNPNGTVASLTDANNNVTSYTYDGFDRPIRTTYPGGSTEQITAYDNNGNPVTTVTRAGQVIGFSYDALNRVTHKGGQIADRDYTYDNLGRMLTATFSTGGQGITNTYDALSRLTSTTSNVGGTARTLSYQYDLAGHRTRVTWPDGFYANYAYLTTGETSTIVDSGGITLGSYGYDAIGNRTSLARGNGTVTSYGFDPIARLTSLTHDVAGTAYDLTKTFAYNPAAGLTSETRSNDAYAWNGAVNVTRGYNSNGLNQYTAAGPASFTYDTNGNLTGDGTWAYGYDAENHMTSASNSGTGVSAVLSYDSLGRLYQLAGSNIGDVQFLYDGANLIGEYSPSTGALYHRYVFGSDVDEPLVQYDGSGNRTWLHADERGSIIARTDAGGNAGTIYTYDEYGIPGSTNSGRFQYTGQMYLYEIGLDYYKARMYSPTLGRFMQTDPLGYGDGPNWYAYTHNDPVNGSDPSGLCGKVSGSGSVRSYNSCDEGGIAVDRRPARNTAQRR